MQIGGNGCCPSLKRKTPSLIKQVNFVLSAKKALYGFWEEHGVFPKLNEIALYPLELQVLFPVYNGECSTAEEPTRKSYAELRECVIQGNLSPGSQLFMELRSTEKS